MRAETAAEIIKDKEGLINCIKSIDNNIFKAPEKDIEYLAKVYKEIVGYSLDTRCADCRVNALRFFRKVIEIWTKKQ